MKFRKIASIILGFTIALFLISNIFLNFEKIKAYPWQINPLSIILIVLLFFFIYLLNIFGWHFIMKFLKIETKFLDDVSVWAYSNLGRYIPGGIWQYGGRVFLNKKKGVSNHLTFLALIFELFFNLISSVLILSISSFFIGSLIQYKKIMPVILFIILSLLMLLIYFLEPLVILGLKLVSKLTKKSIKVKAINVNKKIIPLLILIYSLQFGFAGIALFLTSNQALSLNASMIGEFVSYYTFSWTLGYLTFISPAGLGVQEVSITALISQYMPLYTASIVTVGFRLISIVTEGLFIGIIALIQKRFNSHT